MTFKNSVFSNLYIKDVWTLFSGTAVSQLIGLAFLPVLTRLFTPEEFGIFYIFATTASILSIIATGGYEKTYVLPKQDQDARQLLIFSLMLLVVITIISLGILLFIENWGSNFFQSNYSRQILWLIPVYSFFFGMFRILQNWSIRFKKYNWISTSNILRGGSLAGFQTGFGAFKTGSLGLVLGSCISLLFPLWFLLKKGSKKTIENISLIDLKSSIKKGIEFKSFPIFKMPSELVNEVSIQLPIYVLKAIFNNAIVGIYSLPQKFMSQPSKFIGQAVAEVFYRRVSELHADEKDLSKITFSTFKTLVIIGIIPFSIVMLWGEDIFSLIFSKDWALSGRVAAYISPWLLFVFAGSPISSLFIVKQKLHLSFIFNLSLLILRFGALLVGGLIYKNFEITILLFAYTSFIYWIYLSFYSLYLGGVNIWKSVFFLVTTVAICEIPLLMIKLFLL